MIRRPPFYMLWIAIALLCVAATVMLSIRVESVTVGPSDGGSPEVVANAPYMSTKSNRPQDVTVLFYYRGYGNAVMRFSPFHCLEGGYTLNGEAHPFPDGSKSWCREFIIDLHGDVKKGVNTIALKATADAKNLNNYAPVVGLSIGQPLLGWHLPQTIVSGIFTASLMALLWCFLKRRGFDFLSRAIFMVVCPLYMVAFYKIPQFAFSLDLEKHITYLQYVSDHFTSFSDYRGPESWHPPLYYIITALIAKSVQAMGISDPWTAIRCFSIGCYLTFLYFGMRSLRLLLRGLPYYLGAALLVFWPSGFYNTGWYFNDVLMYPLYAACFYYTLIWYDTLAPRALITCMFLCGIAFTVKTTAFVPATIVGACVLVKLCSRQVRLRDFFNRAFLPAWLVLIAGTLCNVVSPIYDKLIAGKTPPPYLGGDGGFRPDFGNFFLLDLGDLLTHPFFSGWDDPVLWSITLKTMLFTNSYWRFPTLASFLMLMLLLMMLYAAVHMVTLNRSAYASRFPLITGFQVPFLALLTFTLLCANTACRDFRYVQPALVAVIAMFLLGVQEARRKDYMLAYYAGNVAALGFAGLSVVFFLIQFS